MRVRFHRPSGVLTAAALVLFLVGGGLVYAAIPDPDGSIHGCYDPGRAGALRVVESPADCTAGESSLSFNQRGQTGATGAAGPTGQTGPAGPPGPRGLRGRPGASATPPKLKLSDHQVLLLQLKIVQAKLKKVSSKLNTVNAKLDAAATRERRIYLRTYHTCLAVEPRALDDPFSLDTPIFRCRLGFYQGVPGYAPDAAAPGFSP